MYPHSPDMRKPRIQNLADEEMIHIIENGIRPSRMPAFGRQEDDDTASWKLIRFIRQLPDVSPAEITEIKRLNPRNPLKGEAHESHKQSSHNLRKVPD